MSCGRKLILASRLAHGSVGRDLSVFGKYEKAVEEAKKVIELDPDFAFAYVASCLRLSVSLTACEKPRTRLQQAVRAQTGNRLTFWSQRYDIAFLRGDQAGMEREVGSGAGKIRSGRLDFRPRGFCLGIFRPLAAGQEDVAACGGPGSAGGPAGKGGSVRNRSGLVGSLLRECAGGKAERDGGLELSKGRDVEYGAAFALALAGDSSPALKHSRTIWKSAFRRILPSDSVTCRRFAHFSR